MKFFIGGEPFFNPLIMFSKKKYDLDKYIGRRFNYKYRYYTGGGVHSIYQILKNIDFKDNNHCLLPSYLCPTILKPFNSLKIRYKFYKINANLDINNEYLINSIDSNTKAIFFINYFGFPISSENEKLLCSLKEKGIIIIQDFVQAFYSDINLIGDYCFNSFRKLLPADGSVILSNTSMIINQSFNNYKYLLHKSLGQFLRYTSYLIRIDLSKYFLRQFQLANKFYYRSFNTRFSMFSKHIIERIELNNIIRRKELFEKLLSKYDDKALFKDIPGNVIPLGFPIIVNDRDKLRDDLNKENIFCPVHWNLSNKISKDLFQESFWLSNNILTFQINETIDNDKFSKYIELIKAAV